MRERLERDMRVVPLRLLPESRRLLGFPHERNGRAPVETKRGCLTAGCEGVSHTHHGPYKGLCDDCIIALGHWQAVT